MAFIEELLAKESYTKSELVELLQVTGDGRAKLFSKAAGIKKSIWVIRFTSVDWLKCRMYVVRIAYTVVSDRVTKRLIATTLRTMK